jgi:uncharacterized protein YfaS (alpha-2-macroglobulin family)
LLYIGILNIVIETDKKEYRPDDKVKLNVKVTDKNGTPVRAKVNLNLADEALYSLQDQHVNLLSSLYTDYIYWDVTTWKSHYHPIYSGGAESGGEGDSDRKDFRDTILFSNLETDGSGKASAEFKLPDNLTSWRITYHGITGTLQAGSGTAIFMSGYHSSWKR